MIRTLCGVVLARVLEFSVSLLLRKTAIAKDYDQILLSVALICVEDVTTHGSVPADFRLRRFKRGC